MARSRVFVAGAGQLGSRYLQGLAGISQFDLDVIVLEPSKLSCETALKRWNEVVASSNHEVIFASSLRSISGSFDVCIVATPAHCRAKLVKDISSQNHVKAWVLEKVLAQSSSQVDLIERALLGHAKAWVNTPRRVMNWHKQIKDKLVCNGIESLRVKVVGGNWGLACNAVHFIDLVSWWTGATVVGVDCRGIEGWQPSKRPGFQEAFGCLMVQFRDGSSLELSCDQSDAPSQLKVETSEGIWLIEESAGNAIAPSGEEIAGQLSFQSALTAPLVEQILAVGHCELPSLAESAAQHRLFLDALLQHWNYSQSRHDMAVPIT